MGPILEPPFGTPFWTHFGTHFGSILDQNWVKNSTVWSLWVTIEAVNRSQMASGASNESENVQKSAQNGFKMGQNGSKWPTGPFLGHFGPILGVFWAFSGHLGLLDVILGQYAAAGTSHAHNCAPNVEILAFLASFRAILTGFWADFAPLGPFGAFWALFRPFWALLVPL